MLKSNNFRFIRKKGGEKFVSFLLLFSVLLSSCGAPANTTPERVAESNETAPEKIEEVAGDEYEYAPPEFEHPAPRLETSVTEADSQDIASDPDDEPWLDFMDDSASIREHIQEKFLNDLPDLDSMDFWFETYMPAPNPPRKIFSSSQAHSTSGGRLASPAKQGVVFTVTTLVDKDDGVCDADCSLREAIYAANDAPGMDTIAFDLSGTLLLEITLPYSLDPAGIKFDSSGHDVAIDGSQITTLTDISFNNSPQADDDEDCSIYSEGPLNIAGQSLVSCSIYSVGAVYIDNSDLNNSHVYSESSITVMTSDFVESSVYSVGKTSITNSTFMNNAVYSFVYSVEDLSITDSVFSHNNSDSGSIYSEGEQSIENSTINSVSTYSEESLTIHNSTYSNNCWALGETLLIAIGSTFSDCNVYSDSDGTRLISTNNSFLRSTIYSSGTMALKASGSLTVANSTFSGYEVDREQEGMAESIRGDDLPDGDIQAFTNSTILGSFFVSMGELVVEGDEVTSVNSTFSGSDLDSTNALYLYNTIFANNSQTNHVVTDGKNNLIEAAGNEAYGLVNGVNGNIIGANANLGSLAGNGTIFYFTLNASSPAIEGGNDAICAAAPINNTSQNGVSRPQGAHCYIGAYEGAPKAAVSDTETASSCVDDACVSASAGTQGSVAKPINTRTGGYDYSISDISLPTSAGVLAFKREYASLNLGSASSLAPGWVHNQDIRLIFPDDEGGQAGVVLFKAHTSNQYQFTINEDGTYTAYPGLFATLAQDESDYVLTNSHQATYAFDEAGRLLTFTDSNGHTWEYLYGGDGKLTQINADGGVRYLSLEYDPLGRLSTVSDQTGRAVSYAYDANGDLVSAVDVLGQTWMYEYANHLLTRVAAPGNLTVERTEFYPDGRAWKQFDGEDNLLVELIYNADGTTTLVDALGHTSTHTYDEYNTLISETNPAGAVSQKNYLSDFRPFAIIDENGSSTMLSWSTDGINLTKIVDAKGNETSITYDDLNNPTSVIDAQGYLTTYEYDGTLLTKATDALNGETSYTYTASGQVETITDALGHTTTYTYDEFGQMLSVTDATDTVIASYSYDDLGRLVDSTDGQGRVTHNEYDAAGRLLRVTQNYVPAREQNEENLYNIVTEYQYDSVGNQIAVTDTYGNTTQHEYDLNGRMVKSIDPAGNENTSTYNELGQLVASTDALGRITTYAYDAAGRMTSTTDALGNTTTTSYNLDGTVASTTDALGHATTYAYDELKRVVATTDHLGNSTTSSYDATGNLIASSDKLGNTTTYEYDALGRMIRQTDPNGGVTETFYDAAGNRVQTIDARNNATTYAYDELGRMISVTDAQGNVTTTTYNEYGQRTAVTDAKGNTTSFAYDLLGRQVSVTDPLGNTSTTAYDALGRVLSTTDALGNVNTSDYDSLGRLASQTNPAGGVTSFTYNAVGNQLTATDPNGHVRSTAYDALNRVIASTDPKGNTVSTTYNAIGQIVTSTDALGNTSTFAYDELGRQTSLEDALGNISRYDYDANGNRISLTDAKGIVTKFEYDVLGRLTAVVENYRPAVTPTAEINVRTEYSYDANGNRLTITDGNSHVTNFSYDSLNRLTTETDPLGNTWQHSYDANGNRLSLVDANGETTSYAYDENSRLLAIDYPGEDMDVVFNYDEIGRRTQMDDGLGTTAWDYDSLNRPTAITDPFGDTIGYSYDAVGNRTGLTYPDGKQVQYTYDPANLLAQVTDWNSQSTSYTYDANGRVTETSLPNGVTSSYAYNSVGQLTDLQHQIDTTTLSSFQYTYDNVGNRTQVTEFFSGIGEADGGPTVLVTAMSSSGMPLVGKSVYVFDGTTYTGYNKITDGNGQASITLPEGNYRFRLDVDGTQFWSDIENHCQIAGCTDVMLTIPEPVLVSVQDSEGAVMEGLSVYAFDGTSYTGYHGVTDENGQLSMRLPEGDYRFRADFNGTQFWSDAENHCTPPDCTIASIHVTLPVSVSVADDLAMPQAGVNVYAFTDTTYSGYHALTDENGQVALTLPEGEYRFRADFNGTQFWSSAENDCSVPGCNTAAVTVSQPLTVRVQNTNGDPQTGLKVYAFNGSTYAGYSHTTDANGEVQFTLPAGDYRFRADFNGTQFWSEAENSCAVPGCGSASVTVSVPLTVTVQDTDGVAATGLKVYAFDGTSYQGYNKTSDANGEAIFTLPLGSYRFRADLNGTQFWSADTNHCELPGCTSAAVTVSKPVTVMIQNGSGEAESGVKVYAFDGTSYQGYNKTSDVNGETIFSLPLGSYRFRADFDGAQYWSGSENSCDIPDCESDLVIVGPIPNTPTPSPTAPATATSTPVVSQTPAATATSTETPIPSATDPSTPEGSAYLGGGKVLMIGLPFHIQSQPQAENSNVLVTVSDTNNSPASGLKVYAFNGTTYAGINGTTDANGQVSLALPAGEYRFRADLNGTQFWSAEENHCTTPVCTEAALTVTVPLTITISDTSGAAAAGLKVYAFDGTTYAGYTQTTDANGQVVFTLPEGDYRFRADLNGTQFWSGESNHCTLPGCSSAAVTVTSPMTVTVSDTGGTPQSGLKVYAFDETTYMGFNGTTDENGAVVFTLPIGDYRFRADLNGTQFWSDSANHCSLPGCANASVEVTQPITVTVAGQAGTPYPDLNVYAFSGDTYTGYYGVTDENGQIDLTLPAGEYRFRADYDGVQFWSSSANDCSIPECLEVSVLLPETSGGEISTTIDYTYDGLYRLTYADYTSSSTELDGSYYAYTYDAVGNRLTQETLSGTNTYSYDIANRMTGVDGVAYSYDNNGNLLTDGVNTYTYDYANRLIAVNGQTNTTYAYSGLGDRHQQVVDPSTGSGQVVTTNYTLDLAAGLTQVLDDGTNTYLYGNGRIAQAGSTTEYFLGDVLGSVRQLADPAGAVTLTQSYAPYGEITQSIGTSQTDYAFTGESLDANGLTYLRARYYAPQDGRFISRDTWSGNYNRPLSLNRWGYVEGSPVNLTDPSGHFPEWCKAVSGERLHYENCVRDFYGLEKPRIHANAMLTVDFEEYGQPGCWKGPVAYVAPGYVEGASGSVSSTPGFGVGSEVVFDFARMERQKFYFSYVSVADQIALNGTMYSGVLFGFDNIDPVIRAYQGDYFFTSVGVSTDLPLPSIGLGTGGTYVTSFDNKIWGLQWYFSLGLSGIDVLPVVDFEYGFGKSVSSEGITYSYVNNEGLVDKTLLLADIFAGVHSPVPVFNPSGWLGTRGLGIELALWYADIYEEIHVHSK